MARLSDLEISNEIKGLGYEPVNIEGYRNINSTILVKCKEGHEFKTDLSSLRRKSFQCPLCVGATAALGDSIREIPEKTTQYRILAFDQSTNTTGYSIYDNGRLVAYNTFTVGGLLEKRLVKFYHRVKDLIEATQPDFIVFEDIQYENKIVTYKVLAFTLGIGIFLAEALNIEHKEVFNKVWQSDFGIAGANRETQKRNCQLRVKEYFERSVSEDEADAILMGLYMARSLAHKWETKLF